MTGAAAPPLGLRRILGRSIVAQGRSTSALVFHCVHDGAERQWDGPPSGELGTGDRGTLDLVLVVTGVLDRITANSLDMRACGFSRGARPLSEALRLGTCALGEAFRLRTGTSRELPERASEALGSPAHLLVALLALAGGRAVRALDGVATWGFVRLLVIVRGHVRSVVLARWAVAR